MREANDPTTDFTTIVVRPRFVWGPGDQTVLPAVKAMVEKGQFAWIDGGRNQTSTTYIGNLVYAMNLALTKGQGGEAYFALDGPPVEFREFMTRMMKAGGVTPAIAPSPAGWCARSLTSATWRTLNLKGKPPLTASPPTSCRAIAS